MRELLKIVILSLFTKLLKVDVLLMEELKGVLLHILLGITVQKITEIVKEEIPYVREHGI